MTADDSLPQTQRQVLEDHRALLADARGVESIVESESLATGDAARRLTALADNFDAHVADEEESALYTTIPAAHPEFAKELEALKAQHAPILESLRAAADACSHAEGLEFGSPLSIRIRRAVADVREHEAKEADVMQRIMALSAKA